jgi:hypothetical protein
MFKSFLNDIKFWTHHAPSVVRGMIYGKVQIELLILKFKILSIWILKYPCLRQAGILKFWFKRIIRII